MDQTFVDVDQNFTSWIFFVAKKQPETFQNESFFGDYRHFQDQDVFAYRQFDLIDEKVRKILKDFLPTLFDASVDLRPKTSRQKPATSYFRRFHHRVTPEDTLLGFCHLLVVNRTTKKPIGTARFFSLNYLIESCRKNLQQSEKTFVFLSFRQFKA